MSHYTNVISTTKITLGLSFGTEEDEEHAIQDPEE